MAPPNEALHCYYVGIIVQLLKTINNKVGPYSKMHDWTSFDTVFEKASKWTYEQSAVHTILRNRQNLEGVLFFDRIWESLDLKQGMMVLPKMLLS